MSTDTTPAAAIRRLTSRIAKGIEMAPTYSYVAGDVNKDLQVLRAIDAHADVLAHQLAEAEARVDRLRRMVACCKWETERRVPPYIEIDWTGAELDAGIEPGDLAGPARDATGGDAVTATEHTGVVYLLTEATSAHRKTIGVFATLRDLDAWLAANPEPPDAIRESHAVAMYGDVLRMAGPQRGRELT